MRGIYAVATTGGQPRVVIRYEDPTRVVWPVFSVGVDAVYLSVAGYESDIYAMTITVR